MLSSAGPCSLRLDRCLCILSLVFSEVWFSGIRGSSRFIGVTLWVPLCREKPLLELGAFWCPFACSTCFLALYGDPLGLDVIPLASGRWRDAGPPMSLPCMIYRKFALLGPS